MTLKDAWNAAQDGQAIELMIGGLNSNILIYKTQKLFYSPRIPLQQAISDDWQILDKYYDPIMELRKNL